MLDNYQILKAASMLVLLAFVLLLINGQKSTLDHQNLEN